MPGIQERVDVLVQGQAARVDQTQCSGCRDRFADRPGLEQGGGFHRRLAAPIREAVALLLDEAALFDDRQGQAREVLSLHHGRDGVVHFVRLQG